MNTTIETQLEFDFMQPEQLTFTFNKDKSLYFSTDSADVKPSYSVAFYRDNKRVGELDWSKDPIKFEGDVEESAQLFFDNVIKKYIQMRLSLD